MPKTKRMSNDVLFYSVIILITAILFGLAFTTPSEKLAYSFTGLETGEWINEEVRTITQYEWEALKGGEIHTGEGRTDYVQTMSFYDTSDAIESGRVVFEGNEEGATGTYLKFKKGDDIFEYVLSFTQGLESAIDGNKLRSLNGEEINILGENYKINYAALKNNKVIIDLSGSPVVDYLEEGKTRTFNANGMLFHVTPVLVTEDGLEAKIDVNGKISKTLKEGDIMSMGEGPVKYNVAVLDILPNEAGDSPDLVQIAIGAVKIRLTDNDYSDNEFDRSGVLVNNDDVQDGRVRIKGYLKSDDEFVISEIRYRLKASSKDNGVYGDVYIGKDEGMRQHLAEPEGMLSSLWDFKYGGVGAGISEKTRMASASEIKFDASGDDAYRLFFTNTIGNYYEVPFADTSGNLKFGDEDNDLVYTEPASAGSPNIEVGDYFVLNSHNDRKGITHILQYESFDLANKRLVFKDQGAGTTRIISFTGGAVFGAQGFLKAKGGTTNGIIEANFEKIEGTPFIEQTAGQPYQFSLTDFSGWLARVEGPAPSAEPVQDASQGTSAGSGGPCGGGTPGNTEPSITDTSPNPSAQPPQDTSAGGGGTPGNMEPPTAGTSPTPSDPCRQPRMGIAAAQAPHARSPDMPPGCGAGGNEPLPSTKDTSPNPSGQFEPSPMGVSPAPPAQSQQPASPPAQPKQQPTEGENKRPAGIGYNDFVCCESCPTAENGERYYWPFPREFCEPQDVYRPNLGQDKCTNPLYIEPPPPTYAPDCPKKNDLDRIKKEKECNEAIAMVAEIKAAYEKAVKETKNAWKMYEASKYADSGAKAVYDNSFKEAHDIYFNKFLKARNAAEKLCEQFKDATRPPREENAPEPIRDNAAVQPSAPTTPPITPPSPVATPPATQTPPTQNLPPLTAAPLEEPTQQTQLSIPPSITIPPQAAPEPPVKPPIPMEEEKKTCADEGMFDSKDCEGKCDREWQACIIVRPINGEQDCYKCSYWMPPEIGISSTSVSSINIDLKNASTPYFKCFWKCERDVNDRKDKCLIDAKSLEEAKECYRKAQEEYNKCFEICDELEPKGEPLMSFDLNAPQEGRPKADKFDNDISTPLNKMNENELKKIKNLKVGIEEKGLIDFGDKEIDLTNADLDNNVEIGKGSVTVDSDKLPELDKPAVITLYDVHLTTPAVLKDGKPCAECRIISYDKQTATLVFTVSGFTTYTAVNASTTGVGTLELPGGSFPVYVDLATGNIAVDLNADGDVGGDEVKVTAMGGGVLDLGDGAAPGTITLTTEKEQIQGASSDEVVSFSISDSGSKLGIDLESQPALNITYVKDKKVYQGMTRYGVFFEIESVDYANDLTIDYPARGQRYANVGVGIS